MHIGCSGSYFLRSRSRLDYVRGLGDRQSLHSAGQKKRVCRSGYVSVLQGQGSGSQTAEQKSGTIHGPSAKELRPFTRKFVLDQARGAGGFGYDPLFQPEGDTRALAEYSEDEKNAISHRGRAVRRLRELLERLGRTSP